MKKLMYIAIIALFASCQKEESHVCYECVCANYENGYLVWQDTVMVCDKQDSLTYVNNNILFKCK